MEASFDLNVLGASHEVCFKSESSFLTPSVRKQRI